MDPKLPFWKKFGVPNDCGAPFVLWKGDWDCWPDPGPEPNAGEGENAGEPKPPPVGLSMDARKGFAAAPVACGRSPAPRFEPKALSPPAPVACEFRAPKAGELEVAELNAGVLLVFVL